MHRAAELYLQAKVSCFSGCFDFVAKMRKLILQKSFHTGKLQTRGHPAESEDLHRSRSQRRFFRTLGYITAMYPFPGKKRQSIENYNIATAPLVHFNVKY